MKKTAVIFDMDGLMFDTQWIYDKAFDDVALEQYNFKAPWEMHLAMMGCSRGDIAKVAARFLPEGADARDFIRRSFDMVAERVKTDLVPKPGLDCILLYLAGQGCRMGLASGSDRKVVENNLESSGLGHYFAASLCGDEVNHGKPDPESYTRVAAMIGCSPSECYVLEDSPNGILAAFRAGCTPIMVPSSAVPNEEIREMCAGIYETLSDVVDAMERGEL